MAEETLMARRSAALVLLAGTALAVSAAQALAREEAPPPQSGFAPALELIGIRDIQLQLKSHGYDAGPATGAMNEATYRAILAYERDYGLPQDGVAGPMVENALHFMPRRPMPQYAALTPPTVMPPAAPVPPVILPPVPHAAVPAPAPAATSDIARTRTRGIAAHAGRIGAGLGRCGARRCACTEGRGRRRTGSRRARSNQRSRRTGRSAAKRGRQL